MTGWLVVAVVAGSAAAALLVRPPTRVARRFGSAESDRRWPAWVRPVPGAPPWRRRLLLAVPLGLVVAIAARSLADVPVVAVVALAAALTALATIVLGRTESPEVRQATARLQADLPQCWELLSAGLAAGLPLRVALAEVVAVLDGPLHTQLVAVLTRIQLGEPEDQAWRSLAEHPVIGPACRDLARSVASGTSVVELLDEYAAQAREDRHAAAEADAKAIGVRAVLPLMLCFLPAFFLIGIVPIIAGALLPLITRW